MNIEDSRINITNMLLNRLEGFEPDTQLVPLDESVGMVLAGDIAAGENIPGFDSSAAEGFALKSADTAGASAAAPAMLEVAGSVTAGKLAGFSVGAAQCAYINAGGMIPDGADGVAGMKDILMLGSDDSRVFIEAPIHRGSNIIPMKRNIMRGNIVLKKGVRIGSAQLAMLASMGISNVPVYSMPTISVASVGEELVPIDSELKIPMYRDAISLMLANEIGRVSNAKNLGIVEGGLVEQVVNGGSALSIICSNDAYDIMEKHFECLDVISVQGARVALFEANDKYAILLPGHPVQAYFFYKLICEPAIQQLSGCPAEIAAVRMPLNGDITEEDISDDIIPVQISISSGVYTAEKLDIVQCPLTALDRLHGFALPDGDADTASMNVCIFK